jgi:hypothetical protein
MTDEEMNALVGGEEFDDFDSDLGGVDEFEDLDL